MKLVWLVVDNWIDDYSVSAFSERKDAEEHFENLVRENVDPDLDEEEREAVVEKARDEQEFEYSGDGSESVLPCIKLFHVEMQ